MLIAGTVLSLVAVFLAFVAGIVWQRSREWGITAVAGSLVAAALAALVFSLFGFGQPCLVDRLPKEGIYQVVKQMPTEDDSPGKISTLVKEIKTGQAWLINSDSSLPSSFYMKNREPIWFSSPSILSSAKKTTAPTPTPAK